LADVFLAKIDPAVAGAGGLLYGTYLGGNDRDFGIAVAADGSGNAYVTGKSWSSDFPTANPYDATKNGGRGSDVIVAKVNTSAAGAASLLYSTYLGGTSDNGQVGQAIAVGPGGRVTVGGLAEPSEDFPVIRPAAPHRGGSFVAQFDPAVGGAPGLVYATFVGGQGVEGLALAGGAASNPDVFVVGSDSGDDFPTTTNAYQPTPPSSVGYNAFLVRLDPNREVPVIAGVTPRGGPTTGDTAVMLTAAAGSTFAGVTQVRFGTTPAARFSIDSSTQITAVSPACPGCGAAYVSVTDGGGSSLGSRFVYGEGIFTPTGACPAATCGASMVRLANGKVLSVKAGPGGGAHLYDPATGTWGATGACSGCGVGDGVKLTLLGNGKVLRAGGKDPTTTKAVATAYLYDPASGTWSQTASMLGPRTEHTATLLADGRVLVTGGCVDRCAPEDPGLPSAEVFDPNGAAGVGSWTATGFLLAGRFGHTATLLTGPACRGGSPPSYCNKVLVAGGVSPDVVANYPGMTSTELWDPASGLWSAAGVGAGANMVQGRLSHAADLLDGPACTGTTPPGWCGKVLVSGGFSSWGTFTNTAELYDPAAPATARWAAIASRRVAGPSGTAVLASGKVLSTAGGVTHTGAELYDPASGTWLRAGGTTADPTGYPIPLAAGPASACGANCGKVLVTEAAATDLYTPRPIVTAVSPASGPAGTTVTVSGYGLRAATAVSFGATTVTTLSHDPASPDTRLTVAAPAGAGGTQVDVTVTSPGGVSSPSGAAKFSFSGGVVAKAVADFNGDAKSDISIFRPSNGTWYVRNQTPVVYGTQPGDIPVPADYDGNGSTDIAIFRGGTWLVRNQFSVVYGTQPGDIPIPADYDGDGRADVAIFRAGTWLIRNQPSVTFGTQPGDVPVPADYDGDGKVDIAVYRPSNGTWYIRNQATIVFGTQSGDIPVPADYNGDRTTDLAVYRPSNGTWYVRNISTTVFGTTPGDIPLPADYNGDGSADLAIYRRSNDTWYIRNQLTAVFGTAQGDVPLPMPWHIRRVYFPTL
ncbi:MAG: IPT/TIG domain-containing protein, partial [Acidimicrobiales bacterium]